MLYSAMSKTTRAISHPAFGYWLAVISVALAFVAARAFLYFHLPLAIASFSFCAIAITFWYGGVRPGILALALVVLVRTFLSWPENELISRILYDLVFMLFAFFMLQATRARDELESRVAKRTAALSQANETLLVEISERRRAEEALRSSQAYLLEAQRLSHTGSWAWSPVSGDIRYWSEECYRVLGFHPTGSPPRFEAFFQRIHPEDQAASRERFEKAIRDKADYEMDYRIVHPDGKTRNIHVVGHPTLGPSGDLKEFVGTVIDMTERLRAEHDLRRAFEDIRKLKDQLYRENLALREEIDITRMFEEIVGSSPALQVVLSRVAKVAPTDSTVLITGETGTGKELIARAIHKRSQRSSCAFVSVNCAAIPRDLIASELFGHEKGAFTGATQRRLGRFESADGGTIFLDEVGELPPEMQIALLRVLQEREFQRVGGNETFKADVRVVAATNRDLQAAIRDGHFRDDLFYRLNVFPIEVPALRERKEDIPLLVQYFVERYASQVGKKITGIDKRSMELLQSYKWPGNIRELQNVIERSLIISGSENLHIDESWLVRDAASHNSATQPLSEKVAAQEREMIEAALVESKGRVSGPLGAAAKLGIPQSTLDSKIKSLKINKYRFRKS